MSKRIGRVVMGTLIAVSAVFFLVGCGQNVTGVVDTEQNQQAQTQDFDHWW